MEQGTTFTRRDYFKERFTVEELRALLASVDLTPRDILSTRAKSFKELVGDRDLTDDELLALMVQEPTLIRRPLAIKDGHATIGFDKAAYATLA